MAIKLSAHDGMRFDDTIPRYLNAGMTLVFDRCRNLFMNRGQVAATPAMLADGMGAIPAGREAEFDFAGEGYAVSKMTAAIGGTGLVRTITIAAGPSGVDGSAVISLDYTGATDPTIATVPIKAGMTSAQLAVLIEQAINDGTGAEATAATAGSVVTVTCISPVTAVVPAVTIN